MVKAASKKGWLDEKRCVQEILLSLVRAGSSAIMTYYALQVAKWLKEGAFADNYFKYTIGVTTLDDKKPEKIELYANSILMQYLNSQPLHSSQKLIKTTEDGALFSFELYPTPEFDMAILSYGSQVKILKPKTYVTRIKTIVSNILDMYH